MANSVVSRMVGCFAGYDQPNETARRILALRGEKGKTLMASGMGKKAVYAAFDALPKNNPTAPFWGAVRKALENPKVLPDSDCSLGDIPLPNAGATPAASVRAALRDEPTVPKAAKKAAKAAKAKGGRPALNPAGREIKAARAALRAARLALAAQDINTTGARLNPSRDATRGARAEANRAARARTSGTYREAFNCSLVEQGFEPWYA